MASKIPIYKKSSLPIASKDYRCVVQDVRKRQSAIQVKLRDTQNLKTQLGKLAADIEATKDQAQGRSEKEIPPEIPLSRQARKKEAFVVPANTQERSVIHTPGGTKRKGMFSRMYFTKIINDLVYQ